MITHDQRRSLPRGNTPVPSRWQATHGHLAIPNSRHRPMDKPQESERQTKHARRYLQDQSAGPAAGKAITRTHTVDRG